MDSDAEARERAALDEITNRLSMAYQGVHSGEEVAWTVREVHRRFETSPIREFVPVLVERLARQELSSSPGHSRSGPAGDLSAPTAPSSGDGRPPLVGAG